MKREKIKELMMESVLETLNAQPQGQFDKQEFTLGQRYAMKDKKNGIDNRDVKDYSKSFQQGYKSVTGGWWQKFNNKLTDFVSRMGYSRTRGL